MTKPSSPPAPRWSAVKSHLADFDRTALIALVQDLYAASKDNRAFLHARLNLGGDVLKPYKTALHRWLWPDAFKKQDTSIAKAKKVISDYKKAIGYPEGLAELMVFYCEEAVGFSNEVALQDEPYATALERMFAQALQTIATLPAAAQHPFLNRLLQVQRAARDLSYGTGYEMEDLLNQYEAGKAPACENTAGIRNKAPKQNEPSAARMLAQTLTLLPSLPRDKQRAFLAKLHEDLRSARNQDERTTDELLALLTRHGFDV